MRWIYRMSRGLVSPELPFIRKKAVELLKADYPDRDTAKKKIVDGITSYYRTQLSGHLQHQTGAGGTIRG